MMYSLVSIVALFISLSINSDFLFGRNYQLKDRRAFIAYRFLVVAAALYFVFDLLWGFLDAYAPDVFVHIDTSLYFLSMALFLFAWYYFVSCYLPAKKAMRISLMVLGSVFFAGGVALVIANFFTPVLFSYNGAYSAGDGRRAYLFVQIAMFAITAVYAFVTSIMHRGEKQMQYRAIGVSAIIMGGLVIAQYFFPLYPFYAMGCLALVTLVHTFVALAEKQDYRTSIADALTREKEQSEKLDFIQKVAYTDPLTGVKSKHSYVEFEAHIDTLIREKKITEFGILLFDLNDLKVINDTYGHETGDKYIVKSVEIIKRFLPGEDIYRYGGDEFVVPLRGDAYRERFAILDKFNAFIDENLNTNEPIIAAGLSDFVPERDNTLDVVFAKADERMYARKKALKGLTHPVEKTQTGASEGPHFNSREALYETFYYSDKLSLIDMLNSSNCDEILDVDTKTDTFKQIYHVEGKYTVPVIDGSYSDLVDFALKHVVHPDDVGIYNGLMRPEGFFERLRTAKIPNFDFAHFRYKLQGGEYRYVEQVVITGKENGIEEGKFRLFLYDINNLKVRQLGKISDESNVFAIGRDQLTGLLTGKDFFKKAEETIKAKPDLPWALIAVDIEHFKLFGDWFGRKKGDVLLASLGQEIVEAERAFGAVGGYFGQDDFAILVPYEEERIHVLYERGRDIIHSFDLTGGLMPSFGCAIIQEGESVAEAFDHANIAVNKAKADMSNRICIYSSEMRNLAEQEYRILTNFVAALQKGEITFFLQPQVRISTGCLVGAEALVRWIKEDGSVVYPGSFVPVLEKYGFITDLDKYLWDKVVRWISEQLEQKRDLVPISVNVSRVDIFNLDLGTYFRDLCAKYGVPHKLLKIEITESSYAETTEKIDALVKTLRQDGFVVMMDDFGSGYSSLNMLSTLKLDAIKMDARFLQFRKSDEEKGVHILESVINMAKMMAIPVVMEGVETKEQIDFLANLGCRYAQGYYFYKPLNIEKFLDVIKEKGKLDHRGIIVKVNEQFRLREFLDRNIYSDSMLNNILGPVAIYSLSGNSVDIIRYNEQFYRAVNVPDFAERLVAIEQFMPEADRPLMLETLEEAKRNKLLGASANLRFYLTDGTVSFFDIHFYYLDKKEGTDRFYGSAHNVTQLLDAVEEKKLISEYSSDNIIFADKVYNAWRFRVSSNGVAHFFGLTAAELEWELNEGLFAKRFVNPRQFKAAMNKADEYAKKGESFEETFRIYDLDKRVLELEISFTYVQKKSSNVIFLLRATISPSDK